MNKRKVNLEEILFTEAEKLRQAHPDLDLYSNEQMKDSLEYPFFINAMKEATKQALELAAENATIDVVDHEEIKVINLPGYERGDDKVILPVYGVDEDSILNTINQVE